MYVHLIDDFGKPKIKKNSNRDIFKPTFKLLGVLSLSFITFVIFLNIDKRCNNDRFNI